MPPEPEQVTAIQEPATVAIQPARESRAKIIAVGFMAMLVFALSIAAALTWAESSRAMNPDQQVAAAHTINTDAFSTINLEALGAFVIDISSQKVLYAQNADTQLPLASITKVPLVLAVSEVLDPSTSVIISREAVERGEGGGLGTGDVWRTDNLMDFTLLASSNAGAEALAEAANNRLHAKYPNAHEQATVWRMNEFAKELGLVNTYFLNPSGLDISPTQASAFSSAREAALLAAYAAQTNPGLFAVTTLQETALGPQNGTVTRVENTNDALAAIPGLILGKTGFTDLAGGNLVIVFEVEPMRPIAIAVMGSSYDGRFADMKKLVEATEQAITGQARQ